MGTARTGARSIDRLLQELEAKKAKLAAMGGAEKVAKQHSRGKLAARERLVSFFDPGSFVELGGLVRSQNPEFGMKGRDTPADGVVIGHGRVIRSRTR